MRLVEKLELLLNYYLINRKVGHTALLKEGTKHYENDMFILSSHSKDWSFLDCKPDQILSWQNINKLRGYKKPIAIDLTEVIEHIEKIENENEKLKNVTQNIVKLINEV